MTRRNIWQYTVQFWRWQPSAITKEYSKIIIADTKNLRQELSSRPIIIPNTTIKIMQKFIIIKTTDEIIIATDEIIKLPFEMWT